MHVLLFSRPSIIYIYVYTRIICTDYRYVCTVKPLIRHSMGPENNFELGGCWIMECHLPYYLCMVIDCTYYNGQIIEIMLDIYNREVSCTVR